MSAAHVVASLMPVSKKRIAFILKLIYIWGLRKMTYKQINCWEINLYTKTFISHDKQYNIIRWLLLKTRGQKHAKDFKRVTLKDLGSLNIYKIKPERQKYTKNFFKSQYIAAETT